VRTLVQPDYALNSTRGVSVLASISTYHYRSVLPETRVSQWGRNFAPMSRSLPLFDSSADMDSADDVDTGSMWGQPSVVSAIQALLNQATITSEEFNEVRDQVLIALSHMTKSRKARRLAKAILKRLTQCESALTKGRESRARQHLQVIVGLFEKAST